MEETERNQGIQVISRAADILRALARDTEGLSLGQIAKRVELPRSTVQRIVSALLSEGFVSTGSGAGGIRLGPEIQALAEAARVDFADRLKPAMKAISEDTGETVDLAVLEDSRMQFVDQIVGTQRLRTVSNIGEAFPLCSTANGKAALSLLPEDDAARLILAEIEAGKTRRPLMAVLAELERVRADGIARDAGEHSADISALGFALQDDAGRIYAVSVPVPTSRFRKIEPQLRGTLSEWRERLIA